MSLYKKIGAIGAKYIGKPAMFKYGFNLSPMYRRTTARITMVSKDLSYIKIKLPLNYKNRNYVNSIFGGSLFAAVDPIPMVQLMNMLSDEYVVWDKSAEVFFKRPAKEDLVAEFSYTKEELEDIKSRVAAEKEIEIVKTTQLTSQDKTKVFCIVKKTIYVADKAFYKEKRSKRKSRSNQ